MGIKFKNDNIQKKYEYYRNLGLNVGQSLVLSINTYSDYTSSGTEILLEAYKNSKFLYDGVTFSQLYETAYNDCDKKAVENDPFTSINSKLIDMLGLNKQKRF